MYKTLRPAGNKISSKKIQFSKTLFSPFHSQLYQSGTAALSASIIATKNLHPNIKHPKVILPVYTCPDVISAVIYADVTPVLIDFSLDTPFMDLKHIQKVCKEEPSIIAIIAINFLGISERVIKIKDIVSQNNILCIEDSAQGFPRTMQTSFWNGDFVVSSFSRGKPIGLLGGGIVLSKHHELIDSLPIPTENTLNFKDNLKHLIKVYLYNLLSKPIFYYWMCRLPHIQLGQTYFKPLKTLLPCPKYIKNLITSNYKKYKELSLITNDIHNILTKINSALIIDLPSACNFDFNSPLLRYPIIIKDPDIHSKLYSELTKAGLGISTMYNEILPKIPTIPRNTLASTINYPNATLFSKQLLTLPTHEDVTPMDIARIELIFNQILKTHKCEYK